MYAFMVVRTYTIHCDSGEKHEEEEFVDIFDTALSAQGFIKAQRWPKNLVFRKVEIKKV